MYIQVTAFNQHNFILESQDFYTKPPKSSITQESINIYVEKLLKNKACIKVVIRKWYQR